jgi:phenylalanyl-tRNA synthetase beta chain
MRTTLVAGLLLALARNLTRGVRDVRLFEVGDVFLPRARGDARRSDTGVDEERRVAGVLQGHRDGWLQPGPALDFFDAKGVVAELLASLGHAAAYAQGNAPWLHPGVQAEIAGLGFVGELELGQGCFLFELTLPAASPVPVMAELPRFPEVVRDLSFFVAAELPARAIGETLERLRDPLCVTVSVLEDYREAGHVPEGQKSMLWSLTYRAPDRTLTDAEVDGLHAELRKKLAEVLAVTLR